MMRGARAMVEDDAPGRRVGRPRQDCCKDIFRRIEENAVKAEVHVSYVEIYGQTEKLADLLLPEDAPTPALAVRQKGQAEYFVQGLTQYQPENATQMEMFIRAGSERRACASTGAQRRCSASRQGQAPEASQQTPSVLQRL